MSVSPQKWHVQTMIDGGLKKKQRQNKALIDEISATIILQSYLYALKKNKLLKNMVLPIIAYGDPVLRKVGSTIDKDYPDLEKLISNMKDTMKNARGVGLAAPQIGKAIRLFLVDTAPVC